MPPFYATTTNSTVGCMFRVPTSVGPLCLVFLYPNKFTYRISSINTAVRYYLGANDIVCAIKFNHDAPSNSTAHYCVRKCVINDAVPL